MAGPNDEHRITDLPPGPTLHRLPGLDKLLCRPDLDAHGLQHGQLCFLGDDVTPPPDIVVVVGDAVMVEQLRETIGFVMVGHGICRSLRDEHPPVKSR